MQVETLVTAQKLPRVELFRLLAEPGRLQLLALCEAEELSVGELATLLDDSQPQVSRKVAPLRDAGLLDARKDGTRLFLKTDLSMVRADPVLSEALVEGQRLCLADGSLARVPRIVSQREEHGLSVFEQAQASMSTTSVPASPEHLAHLSALSLLLPGRSLAVDVGTGDGLSLDVIAPLFSRVIAVDRSQAQLARVAERVAARGFHHVSLFPGSYDDAALVQRVDSAGGADLVFAGRILHHASRPAAAVQSFSRLLKKNGHLVVLDYLPHDVDALRTEGGDVWLGFSSDDVKKFLTDAGLRVQGDVAVPNAFHPVGPDARVTWHAWVAQKT
ncbi:MAG: metalloregulator ArsR/SmtB family transcription factor [Archangium sp.]